MRCHESVKIGAPDAGKCSTADIFAIS